MKREFTIYRLHFVSPLHLGNERADYAESLSTIHSDTMQAALTDALFKVGWKPPDSFQGQLGCVISSLFPFYQKGEAKPVYFFPRSLKQEVPGQISLEDNKIIKKIKWLDQEAFEAHIHGKGLHELYCSGKTKGSDVHEYAAGDYFCKANIPEDFISKQVFPRVTVSRDGKGEAKPFYMERLFFKENSGMFFITEGDASLLEKGLAILEQEGIGTDRNVGNGFFQYKKDTLELEVPNNSRYRMNLSLFLPQDKEKLEAQLDDQAAYGLKKRGGWISTSPYNTVRKNRIYMFEEGSVFKADINTIVTDGRMVNLKPNVSKLPHELQGIHNIWRNGEAIFIPFVHS